MQTVQQALSAATLFTDNQVYRFVQLPANGITVAAGILAEASLPFSTIIADKDEVTLMLPSEAYDEFQRRLKHAIVSNITYRLITFDVVLEPTLVGFMAHITEALAEAKISVLPFSAYSRDHLFVSEMDFDRAMSTLQALQ